MLPAPPAAAGGAGRVPQEKLTCAIPYTLKAALDELHDKTGLDRRAIVIDALRTHLRAEGIIEQEHKP